MDKGWGPPKPCTTCKWTRVGAPPNPSRLANGPGLGAPPTLHDLQMDKGWGPPTLHDLQMDKGWGPPKPFTTCKWTRVGGPPNWTRVGGPPNPSPTCKWTRVGGPPNPSRLTNGQGLGAPQTLHDLQMDKGWGPPQPFTTCKWTRVGGPQTLHDLQMDKGWGPFNPPRLGAAGPPTLHDSRRRDPEPFTKDRQSSDRALRPRPSPQRKFCSWCNVGLWLGRIWFGWLDGLPRCE